MVYTPTQQVAILPLLTFRVQVISLDAAFKTQRSNKKMHHPFHADIRIKLVTANIIAEILVLY